MNVRLGATATIALATLAVAAPAAAQSADGTREPIRTRVYLGPQLSPSSPGAKDLSFGPFIDVSRARGNEPFDFEAPDESFGFSILEAGGFEFGPSLGFEGKRKRDDLDLPLHEVGFSFEVGAFAQ